MFCEKQNYGDNDADNNNNNNNKFELSLSNVKSDDWID